MYFDRIQLVNALNNVIMLYKIQYILFNAQIGDPIATI